MAPLLLYLRIDPPVFLREDPLPAPFGGGVGVLAVEGHRHLNTAPPLGQVALVNRLDLLEVILNRVTNAVKIDEPFGPAAIGLLCASAVVA